MKDLDVPQEKEDEEVHATSNEAVDVLSGTVDEENEADEKEYPDIDESSDIEVDLILRD